MSTCMLMAIQTCRGDGKAGKGRNSPDGSESRPYLKPLKPAEGRQAGRTARRAVPTFRRRGLKRMMRGGRRAEGGEQIRAFGRDGGVPAPKSLRIPHENRAGWFP